VSAAACVLVDEAFRTLAGALDICAWLRLTLGLSSWASCWVRRALARRRASSCEGGVSVECAGWLAGYGGGAYRFADLFGSWRVCGEIA
jgi:hypothetical protein